MTLFARSYLSYTWANIPLFINAINCFSGEVQEKSLLYFYSDNLFK